MIKKYFRKIFLKIQAKLFEIEVDYINGPDTLPPPLSNETELEYLKKLENAEKKVWRGFRKKPPYRACQEMYKLVMLILSNEGLTPGCELMNDFAERVDASIFLKGTNVFLVDVMPVFIKCEFGTAELAPVSEEERAEVFRFTVAVYRRYMENKNALSRFITRISLFL